MPVKLLKKSGKFVTKGGKLVRTDNPANCDCCGDPPPECRCFPPPQMTGLRLSVRTDAGRELLCVDVKWNWQPPDDCYVDSLDSSQKASIEIELLNEDGDSVGGFGGQALLGGGSGSLCGLKSVACDLANKKDRVAFARGRTSDQSGACPTSAWSPKIPLDGSSPSYDDLCPPPPLSCNSPLPSSMDVSFDTQCLSDNFTLPLALRDPFRPGEYVADSGAVGGLAGGGVDNCVDGVWRVSFGTNLFSPDVGPCIEGTVQRLKCGDSWSGSFDSGSAVSIKLNCQEAPNPLP